MAGYDASIRVNTKVENADLRNLEKEINNTAQNITDSMNRAGASADNATKRIKQQEGTWDSLSAKAEDYKTRLRALEDKGFGFGDKKYDDLYVAWQNAEYAVKKYKNTLDESTDQSLERQAAAVRKVREGFSAAEKSSKKCFKSIHDGTKKSNGLLSIITSRLKGIALSLLVFNWITKGFNLMVSAMKEGFKNLAQYSDDYNESMSALKSQSAQLKNGLAAAFEPLANIIIPYLTTFVSWITQATDSFGRFLAVIQGKSTYTKAKKQVVDYAKSLDAASKSAKGALASFDSIQVLNQSSDSGNASGEATGADAFEEAEVPSAMAEKFAPLIDSLERFKTACEPIVGYISEGLSWLWENVLVPFGGWVLNEAIPAFLNLLSVALDGLTPILEAAQPYLQWLWDNILEPIASWVCDTAIDGIQFLTEKLQAFGEWCRQDEENLSLVKSILLGLLAGIVFYVSVKKVPELIGSVKAALYGFAGICKLFFGIMKKGISPVALAAIAIGVLAAGIIYLAQNWDKLSGAQKAITILGALAAAAIAAAVAIAVFHTSWSVGLAAAAIVGGLALLGLTTACLKSNGNVSESTANDFYNGNDFSASPLPALADGAVIQGGKPFAAILGDQRFGQTNIETPLPTMIAAFKEAITDMGINSGSSGPVYLQIDGKTFAKLELPHIKAEERRIGVSLKMT